MNLTLRGLSMRSRYSAALTALVLVLPAPLFAQQQPSPLTFADAVSQLRQRNEALKAADDEVRARNAERAAAKSLYLPHVDANARYTRLDDPIVIGLNPIRQVMLGLNPRVPSSAIPSFDMTVQDASFWRADLQVTAPLFTGGKITAANRAAEAQVKDSMAERRRVEEALLADLARRYYGVRLASRALVVRTSVRDALERHARDAARLEEEGLVARAERLHAEVSRDEADREVKRAEQDVKIAQAALAAILSSDTALDAASPLFLLSDVGPLEQFTVAAASANPTLGRLAAQGDLAKQGVRAAHARWYPDVFAFALRELHEADLTILDPRWAVGVGARFTLFDGFERGKRDAAATLREQRVRDLDARARRDVALVVEERYRQMAKAVEQYRALERGKALAEEYVRVRSRAFEEGLATSLDVVDARLNLSRVEMEMLRAGYDFDAALAGLLEACGQGDRFGEFQRRGLPIEEQQ